jgi:hypothetical protein
MEMLLLINLPSSKIVCRPTTRLKNRRLPANDRWTNESLANDHVFVTATAYRITPLKVNHVHHNGPAPRNKYKNPSWFVKKQCIFSILSNRNATEIRATGETKAGATGETKSNANR